MRFCILRFLNLYHKITNLPNINQNAVKLQSTCWCLSPAATPRPVTAPRVFTLKDEAGTNDRHILDVTPKKTHCDSIKYTSLNEVFWVVSPCSVVVGYQRFRGPYCLHLPTEGSLKF